MAELLFVVLDDSSRTNLCLVRILAGVSQSAALAEEVPTLIQLDLHLSEPVTVFLCDRPMLAFFE
ncbi:protein of unknown function [Nitrospira japonica]|uniref:Uncharacterized protein n=1 Tax=Nitrospira japonica TaxID=1325564 RepID=A0A1W1I8S3_9BACT|nr:protein of unknown function [Nitrospira japonica]